ncbi:hypothetical protein COV18_05905 [Candidatus Woesearchaeota archaeon CG10_big_fil_rev_8_21_14_0_10_37_12]|nr:MAG: hypothetical protein COV18_05905 [Candidatus Woesearchaeota archaeon CG10_big_fil_rev_8_21_14_0_10_37_12]
MKQTKLLLFIFILLATLVNAQEINITNVNVNHTNQTSVITWQTQPAATSLLQYGINNLAQNASDNNVTVQHRIEIPTTPGETYQYIITSCANQNCTSMQPATFTAGNFFVTADIPTHVRTANIDITGRTQSGATIRLILNGRDLRTLTTQTNTFLFRDIQLDSSNNTIIIRATSATGETTQKNYPVRLDNSPARVSINTTAFTTEKPAPLRIVTSEPVQLNITIQQLDDGNETKEVQHNITLAGTIQIPVELYDGRNRISIIATDYAGFTTHTETEIYYDFGPPQFLETNLNQLTPSYSRLIRVKGTLSEPASVTVFLNNEPEETVQTDSNNKFNIPINLKQFAQLDRSQAPNRTTLETGLAWRNNIRLEAIDAAGRITAIQGDVVYASCSQDGLIDVVVTEPLPDILNTRLLVEGLQQVGLSFNYSYRGDQEAIIRPADIRMHKLTPGQAFQNEYDNALATVAKPGVKAASQTDGIGYIQVNFNSIEDPWALPETGNAPQATEPPSNNPTLFDKEDRLSDHRKGDCLLPGFGCMRILLQIEIPYQESSARYYTGSQRTTTQTGQQPLAQDLVDLNERVHRTCLPIEVAIDRRIPPEKLGSSFLNHTSRVLGEIVENIDKVLKPVENVGRFLFYSCLASTGLMYLPSLNERWTCKYSNAVNLFNRDLDESATFNEGVAAIGKCEDFYTGEALENCKSCSEAKTTFNNYKYYYQQICDRVMCGAAPSLQTYLRVKGRTTLEKIEGSGYEAGSDCAMWMKEKGKIGTGKRGAVIFSYQEIEGIYKDWLEHQSDDADDTGFSGEVNCAGLHPADASCCGYEYMQEWSSACGVSIGGGGLDLFDEIKESTCLSAQNANKNEIPGAGDTTIQCSRLTNALSGFCDANGGPPLEPIRVMHFEGGDSGVTGKVRQLGLATNKEKFMYVLIKENTGGQTQEKHSIMLGFVAEKVKYAQTPQSATFAEEDIFSINTQTEARVMPGGYELQQQFFREEQTAAYYQGQLDDNFYTQFGNYLCNQAGYSGLPCQDGDFTRDDAKDVYARVMQYIGDPEQEYIVNPSSGVINAARCLCFPTLISFLKTWRNILQAVQNCVNSIILTGDGDAGICQEGVTIPMCDLLYDAIACFTQRFGAGGGRIGLGGGDPIGALTSAGAQVSRTVESRYGTTNMYQATFGDRKLVHSICLFAFTGTWNLDPSALFDQALEDVPTESYTLLYPCQRRYVSYDPTTTPGGLVTWVYNFGAGIAAGANLDVDFKLKCSADRSCLPSEGFEGGKCDCEESGQEKYLPIRPQGTPTRVAKGEIFNQPVYFTLKGNPRDGSTRYDTLIMTHRWRDQGKIAEKQTECKIGQAGGPLSVPPHCKFDAATLSFRCMLGEDEGAISLLGSTVDAQHNIPNPAFALGEELNITLDVRQAYPRQDAMFNKYLEYAVMNSAGQTVATNKDEALHPLTTNGDYKIRTTNRGIFRTQLTVTEDWFGTQQQTGRNYQTSTWNKNEPSVLSPNDEGLIADVLLTDATGNTKTEQSAFVIEFSNENDQTTWKLFDGGSRRKSAAGIQKGNQLTGGVYNPTTTIIFYQGTTAQSQIVRDPNAPAGVRVVQSANANIRITFNNMPVLAPGERKQILVEWQKQPELGACTDETKRQQPQRFTITFSAFDADENGNPSNQVSVDPNTGTPAQLQVPFFAVCSEPSAIAHLETANNETMIKQFMRDIHDEFGKAKIEQQEYLTRIDAFLASSYPLDTQQGKGDVVSRLEALLTYESLHYNKIQGFVNRLTSLPTENRIAGVDEFETLLNRYNVELGVAIRVIRGMKDDIRQSSLRQEIGPALLEIKTKLTELMQTKDQAIQATQEIILFRPTTTTQQLSQRDPATTPLLANDRKILEEIKRLIERHQQITPISAKNSQIIEINRLFNYTFTGVTVEYVYNFIKAINITQTTHSQTYSGHIGRLSSEERTTSIVQLEIELMQFLTHTRSVLPNLQLTAYKQQLQQINSSFTQITQAEDAVLAYITQRLTAPEAQVTAQPTIDASTKEGQLQALKTAIETARRDREPYLLTFQDYVTNPATMPNDHVQFRNSYARAQQVEIQNMQALETIQINQLPDIIKQDVELLKFNMGTITTGSIGRFIQNIQSADLQQLKSQVPEMHQKYQLITGQEDSILRQIDQELSSSGSGGAAGPPQVQTPPAQPQQTTLEDQQKLGALKIIIEANQQIRTNHKQRITTYLPALAPGNKETVRNLIRAIQETESRYARNVELAHIGLSSQELRAIPQLAALKFTTD